MTRDEYKRAGDLFDRVRDLPAGEQELALDEACGSNFALRAQVMRLLKADRTAAGEEFLGRPVMEEAAGMIALPPAGAVVGNYRLGRRIGAGGMGVVYEAEDLRLSRRVAVKILPMTHSAEAEERIQRFQREARAAAQLNHPHIAAIYDAGVDQGCHYIAMELVEGRTLREMIGRGAVGSAQVLDVVGQVASALSAAHAAGIIHRDIKPENIMLRPDGFVKVLDFGLASVRETGETAGGQRNHWDTHRNSARGMSLVGAEWWCEIAERVPGFALGDRKGFSPGFATQPGHLAGTVHYLSPEQVLGKAAGPRSDVFSLGVVAYELATGVRPFSGPTDGAIYDAIVHSEPAPVSAVRPALGRELDDLIQHALEKDPELRYQTASDFRSSCLRLTRHSTPSNGTPRPVIRKSRGKRLAVAALALVLASGLTAWWMLRTAAAPHVTQVVQITRSQAPVWHFVNDGARLYFTSGPEDINIKMFQVGAAGGEPVAMPQLDGMLPQDISPDHAQMLLAKVTGKSPYGNLPIWTAPTLGGAPHRLGDLEGQFARWSPTADRILLSEGGSLKIASADGSGEHEVSHVNGYIEEGAWSPDGGRLRFTVSLPNSRRIWEVRPDGGDLHPVSFRAWNQPWAEMGRWTHDGEYYLFSAGQSSHDLWMVRDGLLNVPFRLTNGPLWDRRPQPAADGRRVYFIGASNIGQLVGFDARSRQWAPFLGGLDATQVAYSRDGKWIAYADSKGRLWRSGAEGRERLQLTDPPLFARNPRWSPDGQSIVFYAGAAGEPDSIYVAAANGRSVMRLTHDGKGSGEGDGNWSRDGGVILYAAPDEGGRKQYLYTVDVKSRAIAQLPNTARLWSPRWSPDGKLVAVLDENSHLRLYDMRTHESAALTASPAAYPEWSRDGNYVFFENDSSTAWYRVGIAEKKVELVERLPAIETAPNSAGWVGVTPDGRVISTRTVNSSNLYALELGASEP